jgi:DNA-binding NtrC family response regulator
MNLTLELLRRLDEPGLSMAENALRRCELAAELEDSGSYEAACHALGDLWPGTGEHPRLEGLDASTRAHVLLRCGSLTGWLGGARGLGGAQEAARDLLCESLSLFESLGEREGALRAQLELSWCYWRSGALDDARLMLRDLSARLTPADGDLLALTLVRLAEVERAAGRNESALQVLSEAEPHISECAAHALRGKFHSTRAGVLQSLVGDAGREARADRALIELSAASYHFGEAGHRRYCAAAENNLGFSLLRLGQPEAALEHLERASRMYASLGDESRVAQVDDTRARALLACGRNAEAERAVRRAVRALERCDEQGLLAEALTTLGAALARLRRSGESRQTFLRAAEIEQSLGERGAAGRILLKGCEELSEIAARSELTELYLRADEYLSGSLEVDDAARLRACARRLIDPAARTGVAPGCAEEACRFVQASEESKRLLAEARNFASATGPVLIVGETGTGKEVLARLLHDWGGRRGRFIAVNCAALSDTLFQSQLYGHRKGSFTDALEDYAGLVREAEGGTLYLDEIGEMSVANQAKLLRLIDGGEFYPVGGATPSCADVRILAATNCDLARRVSQGLFRRDLFYRLAAFQLRVPPLRERPGDIPALARHFIEEAAARYAKRIEFTSESFEAMTRLPLQGNARELRGLVERTFITAGEGTKVTGELVAALAARLNPGGDFVSPWEGCSFEGEVLAYEEKLIRLALQTAKGSVTRAAKLLNVTHQGLNYMLNGRHRELLRARKTPRRRHASIITRKAKSASAGRE